MGPGENGETVQFTVKSLMMRRFKLDFNHPLRERISGSGTVLGA